MRCLSNNLVAASWESARTTMKALISGAKDAKTGRQPGLYEPVHGTAPDIAGKGLANPFACILSLAMCLRYSFERLDEAKLVERAVEKVLNDGLRTGDIMQPGKQLVGTRQMGDAVIAALEALSR